MPSLNTLLLLHILGAIVWFGGAVMLTLLVGRAAKSSDEGYVKAFANDFEWVGLRVMMPAMLVIIVAGVWLVIESDAYGFQDTFVSIGLAVFIVSFILGGAFYGPQSKRLNELIAANGTSDAGVVALLKRVVLVSRVELVAITFVVWSMVMKPDWF